MTYELKEDYQKEIILSADCERNFEGFLKNCNIRRDEIEE